jgi:hypothetical protein
MRMLMDITTPPSIYSRGYSSFYSRGRCPDQSLGRRGLQHKFTKITHTQEKQQIFQA